jgi:hypothetical protein
MDCLALPFDRLRASGFQRVRAELVVGLASAKQIAHY